VVVTGTLPTNSNVSLNYSARGTAPSGTTTLLAGFNSFPATAAASFTCAEVAHFNAAGLTIGAGSTVTTQVGFKASSFLTGGTNNYGFLSEIASGSNRWNFYAAGTAQNYFAGDVGIGTATIGDRLNVLGNVGARPATTADTTYIWAQQSDFYSGPSFAGTAMVFSGSTATGTSAGVSNAGLAGILFQNASNALLWTNNAIPLIFAPNGAERMRITSAGNIVAGASAALATTATNGFLYVPTCAGTPTGTPTAITGMAPIVVDTTNNKLYFYSTGQWRDAGP